MPQPFRLRVSFSLSKLPKRQQNFLLSFSKLDGFERDAFLIHLINYFYLTKSNSTSKNIVGFLGNSENKISLTFIDENIVNFLKGYKHSDREIYCLVALFEMSNYLAFQMHSYKVAIQSKTDPFTIAKLESTFFNLGLGSYLDAFEELMFDENFHQNSLIMSASLKDIFLEKSVIIDAYSEQISNELLLEKSDPLEESMEEDGWGHINIA